MTTEHLVAGLGPPDDADAPLPDDAAIIAQSAADPERFAELFVRYASPLKRYAIRRLGVEAAEDVVAETFLTAFRRRDRFDPARGEVRPWLYGIATNLIHRHRRTEVAQYRLLARGGVDPVVEPFTDAADARVSAGASTRVLGGALARLPAGHRDALLLVAWAGLSYEQAAQALGTPVGTVRSRISRAKRKLKDAFDGTDPTAIEETPHA